ncbi:LisH domain-containing protein FOPNL [Paragonimus heterotremus]|uniref:Centrosomal protein 43 n=1 Tax=Paragonimus heterotremus TaxID=100268 RepID=A0A8J4T1C4_9TREM|nr:LisH domain-containing protein FOPNL [Paragonimus heterotremus]
MYYEMASVDEFRNALKASLEKCGILNKLRNELLSTIFETLKNKNYPSKETDRPVAADYSFFQEKLIVNELILEFLAFEGLDFTQSVFHSESELGNLNLPRRTLCQMLGIRPTVNVKSFLRQPSSQDKGNVKGSGISLGKPVPLLYYIVNWLLNETKNNFQIPSGANTSNNSEKHNSIPSCLPPRRQYNTSVIGPTEDNSVQTQSSDSNDDMSTSDGPVY